MQPADKGDRRRAWTHRATQAKHQADYSCERVPIDFADIDRAACAASGAVHVKPRHTGGNGGADRRRPKGTLTGCERTIPPLDNSGGFIASDGPVSHVEDEACRAWWIVFGHDDSLGRQPAGRRQSGSALPSRN